MLNAEYEPCKTQEMRVIHAGSEIWYEARWWLGGMIAEPYIGDSRTAHVSCSTMALAYSEEDSRIADSSESNSLSLSRRGKKCAFDAEMKPV